MVGVGWSFWELLAYQNAGSGMQAPHTLLYDLSVWLFLSCIFYNSSVQLLSHVQLFATSWTAACQASLSITNSWSLLKFMSIESVMPSNHLILCHPLLLLPSIFTSIRLFSNESVLRIRWPRYRSFSFSISPSNEYSGLISFSIEGLISLQSKRLSRVFFNTTKASILQPSAFFMVKDIQKHSCGQENWGAQTEWACVLDWLFEELAT